METNKTPKTIPTTFQGWVKQTFTWVDNDVKRYMQRAWTASTNARNVLDKQETKALKQQNEEYRELLKEIHEYLNLNDKNYVGSGSKLHQSIQDLLTKYNK
jgi:predicted RNA-binding protein with EMAP domain